MSGTFDLFRTSLSGRAAEWEGQPGLRDTLYRALPGFLLEPAGTTLADWRSELGGHYDRTAGAGSRHGHRYLPANSHWTEGSYYPISASSRLSTLPVGFLGSSSTNTISRGTL